MFQYTRVRNHTYDVNVITEAISDKISSINLAGDDSIVTTEPLSDEEIATLIILWGAQVRGEQI